MFSRKLNKELSNCNIVTQSNMLLDVTKPEGSITIVKIFDGIESHGRRSASCNDGVTRPLALY